MGLVVERIGCSSAFPSKSCLRFACSVAATLFVNTSIRNGTDDGQRQRTTSARARTHNPRSDTPSRLSAPEHPCHLGVDAINRPAFTGVPRRRLHVNRPTYSRLRCSRCL
eukprot:2084534-Prymnesium_polylepis.4